ncbi:MAG: hypothetical protein ACOCXT_06735 [Candidatus Dojkabacteria bacterium]
MSDQIQNTEAKTSELVIPPDLKYYLDLMLKTEVSDHCTGCPTQLYIDERIVVTIPGDITPAEHLFGTLCNESSSPNREHVPLSLIVVEKALGIFSRSNPDRSYDYYQQLQAALGHIPNFHISNAHATAARLTRDFSSRRRESPGDLRIRSAWLQTSNIYIYPEDTSVEEKQRQIDQVEQNRDIRSVTDIVEKLCTFLPLSGSEAYIGAVLRVAVRALQREDTKTYQVELSSEERAQISSQIENTIKDAFVDTHGIYSTQTVLDPSALQDAVQKTIHGSSTEMRPEMIQILTALAKRISSYNPPFMHEFEDNIRGALSIIGNIRNYHSQTEATLSFTNASAMLQKLVASPQDLYSLNQAYPRMVQGLLTVLPEESTARVILRAIENELLTIYGEVGVLKEVPYKRSIASLSPRRADSHAATDTTMNLAGKHEPIIQDSVTSYTGVTSPLSALPDNQKPVDYEPGIKPLNPEDYLILDDFEEYNFQGYTVAVPSGIVWGELSNKEHVQIVRFILAQQIFLDEQQQNASESP